MVKQFDPAQLFIIFLFFLVFYLSVREAMHIKFGKPASKQTEHKKGNKDPRGLLVRLWALFFRGAHLPKLPDAPKVEKPHKQNKDEQLKKLLSEGERLMLQAAKATWTVAHIEGSDGLTYTVLLTKDKMRRVVWYVDGNGIAQFNNIEVTSESEI